MLKLEDIDDLVADLRAGELDFDLAYDCLLQLLRWHSVEDMLGRLPPPERERVVTAMQRDFDNDVPPAEYIWFSSGRGDQPDKQLIIDKLRTWLPRSRLRPGRGRGPSTR